jgi:nucleotide-binding universal stress UspA family protein
VATIIVGVEDSPRSEDAVALAGDLARITGAEVLAVCAFPYDERPAAHFNAVMRAPLNDAAWAILERLTEPLSDLPRVRRLALADPAPARALLAAAEIAEAQLIVVGSSHAGFHGRLHPGSTAARLLQGAPVAVALAPQGHRLRPQLRHERISAAFDGSANAHAALQTAAQLADASGMALRVTRGFQREWTAPPGLHVPPGFVRMTGAAEKAAREELEDAVEALPHAESAFLLGDPGRALVAESEVSHLMVVGSRGYGPAPAVLLGELSGRLVHAAACPVIVVPNGVASPLDELYGQASGKLRTTTAV